MYLCHVHRYADEDEPCDECASDFPERTAPSSNRCREATYQDAVTRLREAMDRLREIQAREVLWRQGAARD